MAWVRIESSVSRHPKFLDAGPAASWLWICALAYCQEGLTDGFIPSQAVQHLGVKVPAPLISRLVKAGLWDECEGGWRIHDYLKHNKSSSEIQGIKAERRSAGARGGAASWASRSKQSAKQVASANVNHLLNPSTSTSTSTTTATVASPSSSVTFEDSMDVWWVEFVAAYPESRRQNSRVAMDAFIDAFEGEADKAAHYRRMRDALANHIASEQWADRNVIPAMTKWLTDRRWVQTLPPSPRLKAATVTILDAAETRRRYLA